MRDPGRRTALVVAIVGSVLLVLLAWWWVPWDPTGRPVAPAPVEDLFTREEVRRAESYARWARTWSWSSLLVSLAVACLLGFTPLGRRLVDRLPGPLPVVVLLAVAACELAGRVATLPFAIALQSLRRDRGLATGTWVEWGRDVVVAQGIVLVPLSLGVLLVVVGAHRWRRTWPAVVGALLAGGVVLMSFVYPVVVEPAFNRFEPLPTGPLRAEVLALAQRQDVDVDAVLVADASRRTTTLNAYVSGFGPSKRVVLYDTLLEGTPEDEVLAVVAHELAHARYDDPLHGTLLGALGAAAAVGALGLLLGTRRAAEPARVPTVLALVAVSTLLVSPVASGVSRRIEARADVAAVAATGDPSGFVALQRRLALRSLADPTPPPLAQWWFGTHPTVLERIGAVRPSGARG